MKKDRLIRWVGAAAVIILFGWWGWVSRQSYLLQSPALFKQNLPWIWVGITAFVLIVLIRGGLPVDFDLWQENTSEKGSLLVTVC